jgi:putative inorganic carbon (hco3(-)) transporter
MRDILLAVIVFGSIPLIIRRPQIGVVVYVWLSVMNPHRLTFGFSYAFNYAAIVAIATLIAAVLSNDLKRPPWTALTVTLFLFGAWTGITTLFALHPADSFEMWQKMVKTLVMAFLIPMLFHRKEDLRLLVWVIALSIAYYGTKGGIWTLMTGGDSRVLGPDDSYIADNTAIAVAVVMTIPLLRYLQMTSPHRFVRLGLTAMMLFCGVAVLGTYSRGALLAVIAMVAFLWLKGRQKLIVLLIAAVSIPFTLSLMPEKWYDRMATILAYDQDDSSSMRLNAWGTMFNVANARPIVGGGFEVAQPDVYQSYSPDRRFPPQVAHSIYFQALGEHGYVGLALYLFLLYGLWRTASRAFRATRAVPELAWIRDFSLMMQVTLIGFLVGGAFLSLVNFDVPYYLIGVVVATQSLMERKVVTAKRTSARATAGGLATPELAQNRPG